MEDSMDSLIIQMPKVRLKQVSGKMVNGFIGWTKTGRQFMGNPSPLTI